MVIYQGMAKYPAVMTLCVLALTLRICRRGCGSTLDRHLLVCRLRSGPPDRVSTHPILPVRRKGTDRHWENNTSWLLGKQQLAAGLTMGITVLALLEIICTREYRALPNDSSGSLPLHKIKYITYILKRHSPANLVSRRACWFRCFSNNAS